MSDELPETPLEETAGQKKSPWPIIGWIIIAVMGGLILLNLLGWVSPEINRVSLPGLVIAYLIYVVFRRRKT